MRVGFTVGSGREAQEILEREARKHNLLLRHGDVSNWAKLRKLLLSETTVPGAKAAIARRFKVTTQAVSQWLSGKTMPSADTALRLRDWLLNRGTQRKPSVGRVTQVPARKSGSNRPKPKRSIEN